MHTKQEFRENFPWSLAWFPGIRSLLNLLYTVIGLPLGWVWPVPYTIGLLLFTNFSGWDPLLWRSFDKGDWLMDYMTANYWHTNDYSDHHFLNLLSIAVLFFVMAFWLSKQLKTSLYRTGLLASYAGLFVWSLHEGIWWITYIIYYPHDYLSWRQFTGAGEIITIGLVTLSLVMGSHFPKRYFAAMLLFYLVWVAFGFPLTNSYLGPTAGYSAVWNNGWEVGSWIYAATAYFVLERKSLLGWYLKVKQITSNSQTLLGNHVQADAMLTEVLTDFSATLSRAEQSLRKRKAASSALGAIVILAVGIILIATLGMQALQILATSGTTSFQPAVVTMMVIVVPIIFAIALIVVLLKHGAGIHI